MIHILDLLLAFLNYGLCILFFSFYVERKEWVKGKAVCAAVAVAGLTAFGFGLPEQHMVSILVHTAILAGLCFGLYIGDIKTRFLMIGIFLVFDFFLEMGTGFIAAYAFKIPAVEIIDHPEVSVFATFVYLVLKALFVYLAGKKSSGAQAFLQLTKFRGNMVWIPFLSFLGIVLYGYSALTKAPPDYLGCCVVILFLVLLNSIYFMVLYTHARLYRENYEHQMQAKEYEMKVEYYRNVEHYQKEIRTIKHDLKNQLLLISAYMDRAEKGQAAGQIRAIIEDLQEKEQQHFTTHPGINMLLSTKYHQAVTAGITCEFEIKVSEDMRFEERDLGSLIGNIMDNGIEACMRCTGVRYLKFQMVYFRNSLVIKTENSTDGEVAGLETRKKNAKEHGLGMQSIQAIVKKYQGDVEYIIKGDQFQLEINMWEPRISG